MMTWMKWFSVAVMALVWTFSTAVFAQEQAPVIDAPYRFTVRNRPVSGTLWLYYYGWGFLERERLGVVQNGNVHVLLSWQKATEIRSVAGAPTAYLVALNVPRVGWYRSSDFGDLHAGIAPAIASLGTH